MLPIWTLPPVREIHDKTQVVFKELTRNGVQSKVAKSAFVRTQDNCGKKFINSRILFHLKLFQWGWIMRLKYIIKCRFSRRK